MGERFEALVRIVVGIISGIIIGLWGIVAQIAAILHWFYVLIFGKRSRRVAEFCHGWVHEVYRYTRYLVFHTNERPFPFTDLDKKKRKFE